MSGFFDTVRARFGRLSQGQVDGFNAIINLSAGLPLTHRAYMLATAWHETAHTMQPITEYGAHSYFDKYEPGTAIGKALGNTLAGDGFRYRGRGYVQLTGRRNYVKASAIVGHDLAANPDVALIPAVAAQIMINGMTAGWFTGKKLADFTSYPGMRRVINGTDKAAVIAGYAQTFESALKA